MLLSAAVRSGVLTTTERGAEAGAVESGAHGCTVGWAVGAWGESYGACEGELGDRLETLE